MDNKYIIFGTGKILRDNIDKIDLTSLVVFCDNNREKITEIYGKKVISPEEIRNYEYDKILIASSSYFNEIYVQLLNLNISADKISSLYSCFTNCLTISDEYELYSKSYEYADKNNLHSILDYDLSYLKCSMFSIINHNNTIKFWGFNPNNNYIPKLYNNVYDKCFTEIKDYNYSDAVAINSKYHDTKSLAEALNLLSAKSRYVMIILSYSMNDGMWDSFDFSLYGKCEKHCFYHGYFIAIDTGYVNKNYSVYVVTHKSFSEPKDSLYVPIHAGKALGNDLGYLGDDTGDNISHLNKVINECTAMYWIWKNDKTSDYVGINHYRRYFCNNDNTDILQQNEIKAYFERDGYDIIVSKQLFFYENTCLEEFKTTMNEDLLCSVYNLIQKSIEEKHPDYLPAYEFMFNNHGMYACNLFITSKAIYDSYCEWLFDIILPIAENIDVSGYDSYSQRVVGFFAERLLTVWLLNNDYRIKELPMKFIEDV